MAVVRYFVNADTRRARLGYGQEFADQMLAAGFAEVTSEQFEAFRAETLQKLRDMVAQ